MKPLQKSKTFWVNILMVIAGGIGGVAGTNAIQENPALVGYAAAVMGVVNIILRMITKDSIK